MNNIIISITSIENISVVEMKVGGDYSTAKQMFRKTASFPFRAIIKCLLKIARIKYHKKMKNFNVAERIARL